MLDLLLNQVITEHGAIPTFWNKMFGKPDECSCGFHYADVNHIIMDFSSCTDNRKKNPLDWKTKNIKELLCDS